MIVEAQYNWRGELAGYRRENSFIPLDYANNDCKVIQDAIAIGQCAVNEPSLGNITKAFDRHGVCSGYNTSFGFIYSHTDNRLLKLIAQQIIDGRCVILDSSEKLPIDESSKISTIILCVMLEKPLPHIVAEFHGKMSYGSHEKKTTQKTFEFSLKNLPLEQPCSKVDLVLSHHGLKYLTHINLELLQFGVIEIKVPVNDLRWLFKGERKLIQEWISPLLNDILEQHYAKTGRKTSEGPDIEWLINNVSNYLQHFIVEFSNRVLEAFSEEYGQVPLPYVSEAIFKNNIVVLGRSKSGNIKLQNFILRNSHSFNLSGEWPPHSIIRFQEESATTDYHRKIALHRVSDMLQLGMHVESLAFINAFLEVTIKKTLRWSTPVNSENRKFLELLGYRSCLEILEKVAKAHSNKVMFNGYFLKCLQRMKEIYRHRNLYVHALELDEHVGRLTVSKRRQIESMLNVFVDLHKQQQFLMRLDYVIRDTAESHQIIQNELKNFMIRNQSLFSRFLIQGMKIIKSFLLRL